MLITITKPGSLRDLNDRRRILAIGIRIRIGIRILTIHNKIAFGDHPMIHRNPSINPSTHQVVIQKSQLDLMNYPLLITHYSSCRRSWMEKLMHHCATRRPSAFDATIHYLSALKAA